MTTRIIMERATGDVYLVPLTPEQEAIPGAVQRKYAEDMYGAIGVWEDSFDPGKIEIDIDCAVLQSDLTSTQEVTFER